MGAPDRDETLLQHLLGPVRVPQDAQRHAEQGVGGRPVQPLHCLLIAACAGGDEVIERWPGVAALVEE